MNPMIEYGGRGKTLGNFCAFQFSIVRDCGAKRTFLIANKK